MGRHIVVNKKKTMNIVIIDKSMDQDNFDPFNFAYI